MDCTIFPAIFFVCVLVMYTYWFVWVNFVSYDSTVCTYHLQNFPSGIFYYLQIKKWNIWKMNTMFWPCLNIDSNKPTANTQLYKWGNLNVSLIFDDIASKVFLLSRRAMWPRSNENLYFSHVIWMLAVKLNVVLISFIKFCSDSVK